MNGLRCVVILLAAWSFVMGGMNAVAQESVFGPEVVVSEDDPALVINDLQPALATDGNGAWVMTWLSNNGLDGTKVDFNVHSARLLSDGSWSAPINLSGGVDPAANEFFNILFYDGFQSFVGAWFAGDSLVASRSADQGQSWSEPVRVNTDQQLPFTDIYSGIRMFRASERRIGIYWGRRDITKFDYVDSHVSYSSDGGLSWSAPRALNFRAALNAGVDLTQVYPRGATDGKGNWIIGWTTNTFGFADGYSSRSSDDGATWRPPELFTAGSFLSAVDVITNANGTWFRSAVHDSVFNNLQAGSLLYRSIDNGASWQELNTGFQPPIGSRLDRIQRDGAGNWFAGATRFQFGAPLTLVRSIDNGATWHGVSHPSQPHGLSVAGDAHGNTAIAWVNELGLTIDNDVHFARTPNFSRPTTTVNFAEDGGNAHGWVGGAAPGFGGAVYLGIAGLCMAVPDAGENLVLWASPEKYVELHSGALYRARVALVTDQTAPDAIPIFFFTYDNFIGAGEGNNYGGFAWVVDVDGGSQGIGRPQGRDAFDFYAAPNALSAPQWVSLAFGPEADSENDMRLQFRAIDANPGFVTSNDSGTVCVSSLEITTVPRASLIVDEIEYAPPISSATHFIAALNEVGTEGTESITDANEVRYQLGESRRTLGPYDPSAGTDLNVQLFPVLWESDRLYRSRVRVRSGLEDSDDPLDAIFVALDTTTQELGVVGYTTRGAPGSAMDGAASAGRVAAEYEVYLFSHNTTASATPNAARLRPLAFFMNTPEIAGLDSGRDAFIVGALEVDRLVTPP